MIKDTIDHRYAKGGEDRGRLHHLLHHRHPCLQRGQEWGRGHGGVEECGILGGGSWGGWIKMDVRDTKDAGLE